MSLISESETHILYKFNTHRVKYFKPLFLEIWMSIAYRHAPTGYWEQRDVSRWPGGWFGLLPCVFIFIIIFLFICLPSQFTKVINSDKKSIINRLVLTGSATLHICSFVIKRFEQSRCAGLEEVSGKKKQLNVAKLLTYERQITCGFKCKSVSSVIHYFNFVCINLVEY